MSRLRVRIELNRGGVGVPLNKLASVVHEAQRFFEMLAEDVHITTDAGEWLGFDFDHESLNFTAEFVGPVTPEQTQAFYAAFDGTTSLRRATIAQFTQITEAIGEDELIGFGLYQSDQEAEPAEWRCLSRRDALRIADEMRQLIGVAGEAPQETHLPAVTDSSAGARLFKERPHRGMTLPDIRIPELVREVESSLSKRINRLEDHMESSAQAIRELRESSAATEESFKGLLNAVENFCGQATRQLERLAAPNELPPATPAGPTAPAAIAPPAAPESAAPVTAARATNEMTAASVPRDVASSAPAAGIEQKSQAPAEAEETTPKPPGSNWRAMAVAAAVVVVLATAGILWWPRGSDSSGSQVGSGNPSSVIASSQPSPANPGSPSSPGAEAAKPPEAPVARAEADRPNPMPMPARPVTNAAPAQNAATPAPGSTMATANSESMHVEIEAKEPVWVMITDKDGKILIARTLQANETRELEVSDDATLRTGNAGGLRVRLNGKDLGRLGPTGKIRDVQFKSGEFKVSTPDNG